MTGTEPQLLRDGRYAIVGLLGEGAQGATLEAVDKQRGRPVAVKRFQVRGAKSWKDVELAEREARVLSVIDHPALPDYVEHFEEDGCLYLVMEKIEGERLSSLRTRGVHFSQADIVRFLRAASDALDYLHSRAPPIIHRDIKPGNVIRRPDGTFAFVDFGAVRDSLRPEGGSTVVGTFGYMAPEQFQSRAMPASDVYSVGATALTMLTGREPEDLPHQGLGIDVRAALAAHVDPALVQVLAAMVVPDPDRRAGRIAPWLQTLPTDWGRAPRGSAGAASTPPPRAGPPRDPASDRSQDSFVPPSAPWSGRGRGRGGGRSTGRGRRWGRRHARHHHPLSSPFVMVAALLGLSVAQVAVFFGLRVLAPFVLTILALVFGKAMRRAARAVSRAGVRANQGLRRAGHVVRERGDQAAAMRHADRARTRAYRVSPPPTGPGPGRPRTRVDEADLEGTLEADDELDSEVSDRASPRRRR